jgi:hypothetical protein
MGSTKQNKCFKWDLEHFRGGKLMLRKYVSVS